jgi:hypothetical protein
LKSFKPKEMPQEKERPDAYAGKNQIYEIAIEESAK